MRVCRTARSFFRFDLLLHREPCPALQTYRSWVSCVKLKSNVPNGSNQAVGTQTCGTFNAVKQAMFLKLVSWCLVACLQQRQLLASLHLRHPPALTLATLLLPTLFRCAGPDMDFSATVLDLNGNEASKAFYLLVFCFQRPLVFGSLVPWSALATVGRGASGEKNTGLALLHAWPASKVQTGRVRTPEPLRMRPRLVLD